MKVEMGRALMVVGENLGENTTIDPFFNAGGLHMPVTKHILNHAEVTIPPALFGIVYCECPRTANRHPKKD